MISVFSVWFIQTGVAVLLGTTLALYGAVDGHECQTCTCCAGNCDELIFNVGIANVNETSLIMILTISHLRRRWSMQAAVVGEDFTKKKFLKCNFVTLTIKKMLNVVFKINFTKRD